MAWVVEGLDGGFIAGSPRFGESSGKTSQTVSHSFSISAAMCFWSASKGEMVNLVEVLTGECVEVWENFRFDPYSNEGLLFILQMGIEAQWGRGHDGMAVGSSMFGP